MSGIAGDSEHGSSSDQTEVRDRLARLVVLGLVGVLAGAFVPLVGGWRPDGAWTAFVVLVGGVALAAGIATTLEHVMPHGGLARGSIRTAKRAILPLSVGVVIGAAVTTASMTASETFDGASLLEDIALVAIVIILFAIGSVGFLDGYRHREAGESIAVWVIEAPLGPVGYLVAGVGMLLIATSLMGPDPEPSGQSDTPFTIGVAMFVAGFFIARIFRRRRS